MPMILFIHIISSWISSCLCFLVFSLTVPFFYFCSSFNTVLPAWRFFASHSRTSASAISPLMATRTPPIIFIMPPIVSPSITISVIMTPVVVIQITVTWAYTSAPASTLTRAVAPTTPLGGSKQLLSKIPVETNNSDESPHNNSMHIPL